MRRPPKYCHFKTGGYWYFDRPGYARVRLPGLPWSPEFMAAYERASKGTPMPVGAGKTVPGTMNALIVSYYQSSLWRALKPATQTTYRGVLENMREEHGAKRLAGIERKHIKAIIEKKGETPAAANRLLSIFSILLDHALDLEWIGSNPAKTVKKLRYKKHGFHTWTDDEIAAYRAHWRMESRERLAFEMLLGTAQRSGDVRRMEPGQIARGKVSVAQEKTAEHVTIPLLPELAEAMEAAPVIGKDTILVTSMGKPFTEKGFYNFVKDACKEARLAHCSPHGLRKAAARRLAEAGCSPHQIAAITGHKTLKEVERYTREANKTQLAEQAYGHLKGTQSEQ